MKKQIRQTTLETGDVSSQVVKCQRGKRYSIPYVVYEKTFPCRDYPPDGIVTFRNITVECDGVPCTQKIEWAAKVKDDNCNMAAHIGPDNEEISITWDTSLASKYDNMTYDELHALNGAHGWGKRAAEARAEVVAKVAVAAELPQAPPPPNSRRQRL